MRGRDEGAQEDEATHIDMQRRRRPQQADDSLPSLSAMLSLPIAAQRARP